MQRLKSTVAIPILYFLLLCKSKLDNIEILLFIKKLLFLQKKMYIYILQQLT